MTSYCVYSFRHSFVPKIFSHSMLMLPRLPSETVPNCIGHYITVQHFGRVFRENIIAAVFDDCWLVLLDVGDSLDCVVGLLAVSLRHSLLFVNALAQSTLLLLPSSSSWLLCSLDCALVLFQCLCTSVVSAAVSGRTDPEPRLWPKVESSSSASQALLQLLRLDLQ